MLAIEGKMSANPHTCAFSEERVSSSGSQLGAMAGRQVAHSVLDVHSVHSEGVPSSEQPQPGPRLTPPQAEARLQFKLFELASLCKTQPALSYLLPCAQRSRGPLEISGALLPHCHIDEGVLQAFSGVDQGLLSNI